MCVHTGVKGASSFSTPTFFLFALAGRSQPLEKCDLLLDLLPKLFHFLFLLTEQMGLIG